MTGHCRAVRTVLLAVALVLSGAVASFGQPDPSSGHEPDALRLRVKPLPPGVRTVDVELDGAGAHVFALHRVDGTVERVTPEQFAGLLHAEATHKGFLYRLLNISSPIGIGWVVLGLLGQVLFTGRMLVQWLVSEREKRSVVPVAFWWMSLAGASMLLVYFVWRRDIVGVLGQSAGWVVYGRNLLLIHRGSDKAPAPA